MRQDLSVLATLSALIVVARAAPAENAQSRHDSHGATTNRVTSVGPIRSVRVLRNGLKVASGQTSISLLALDEGVVRVRISPKELAEDHSWAVLPQMLRSSVDVTPINSPAEVGFATRELRVSLQRNTGKITFANSGGDVISADYAARPASFHGSSFKVYKAMPPNEHYFGLGDKPGPLDRRSRAFAMWNTDAFAWQESTDPLYKSIPFFLSLRD